MPITLSPNYLEYRINNRTVRYDIVMSRHSHRQHIWKIRPPRLPRQSMPPSICYIQRPLSYPYYHNIDKFSRKIK